MKNLNSRLLATLDLLPSGERVRPSRPKKSPKEAWEINKKARDSYITRLNTKWEELS